MQKNPEEIRFELIKLIEETQAIFPNLSLRLDEMRRWIADKRSGLLMRKPHVMQLIEELLRDATFWFEVQLLPEEDREAEFALLSPTEQYWYKYLFPAWINERDPKLSTWKKKLMAGDFEGSDASQIDKISQEIEFLGGDTLNSYIADLSMATDLIASGVKDLPLCVQLTSVRDVLAQTKQADWLSTLKYWGIKRGVFISFNPTLNQVESKIGQYIFQYSDRISENCYPVVNMDK
ncbi:hypothetical protein FACHB389_17695 [Nostoc calcicola FACHB-389]|nr:hypothetical protein [Nostoc calcicola FACHB-3891]OKH33626.1 hypothetical protein FACHB389_17695 [Nostoc calcicola FACHB-389]